MKELLQKIHQNLSQYGVAGFTRWSFNYARWILYRRIFQVRFFEKRVNDYRLVLDLADLGISKELMLNKTREEDHIYVLKQCVKRGMTILDCGANIGYYSVMLAKLVGPLGMVYAIEPDFANYYLLNVNISLNNVTDRVKTFNHGLSNKNGTEKFFLSVMSNRHTFYVKEYSGVSQNIIRDTTPIDIPVMTLGTFANGKRPIDLVRMDIEGYEVEVFQGILADIENNTYRPSILFEVHRSRYDAIEHDLAKQLWGLFEKGYCIKWLVSDQHLRGKSCRAYKERGYSKDHIVAELPFSDRAIYRKISNEDAVDLICNTDWVRAALLEFQIK